MKQNKLKAPKHAVFNSEACSETPREPHLNTTETSWRTLSSNTGKNLLRNLWIWNNITWKNECEFVFQKKMICFRAAANDDFVNNAGC